MHYTHSTFQLINTVTVCVHHHLCLLYSNLFYFSLSEIVIVLGFICQSLEYPIDNIYETTRANYGAWCESTFTFCEVRLKL